MRRFLLLIVFACSSLAFGRGDETTLYQKVLADHVVQLEAEDGFCTAVMVGVNTFLTANHCTSDPPFYLHDQFEASYPADVIKQDEVLDLALLHSRVYTKRPITIAADLPDATPVMGIGFSAVFSAVRVPSYITGNVLTTYKGVLVVVTHAFRPGYSGGPLVTLDGKLVGINVMSDDHHNIGLSMGLKVIRFFLEQQ